MAKTKLPKALNLHQHHHPTSFDSNYILLIVQVSHPWCLLNTTNLGDTACKTYPELNHFLPLPGLPSGPSSHLHYWILNLAWRSRFWNAVLNTETQEIFLNLNVIISVPFQNSTVLSHFTQSKSWQRSRRPGSSRPRSLFWPQAISPPCLFPSSHTGLIGIVRTCQHLPTLGPLL